MSICVSFSNLNIAVLFWTKNPAQSAHSAAKAQKCGKNKIIGSLRTVKPMSIVKYKFYCIQLKNPIFHSTAF